MGYGYEFKFPCNFPNSKTDQETGWESEERGREKGKWIYTSLILFALLKNLPKKKLNDLAEGPFKMNPKTYTTI